jgi:dienelactone hydrolase
LPADRYADGAWACGLRFPFSGNKKSPPGLEEHLSPQPDLLSNKPVAAGIRVIRTVSVAVLVTILLILAVIGLFGAMVHFRDHREVVLPKPTGPYAVGRALFDWKDPKRNDPYSAAVGKQRELMVWLWYPATTSPQSKAAEYIPSAWASELPWRPVTIPSRVRVHAVADAPIAADRQAHPVLVFSTGFGNLPSDYTSLIEDIVSHGYVVLGITNTYSAPVVRFPDGRVAGHLAEASFPRGPEQAIRAAGNRMVKVWAADLHFAIDSLVQMNLDSKTRFYGRLDLARLGLFGQSFGGAAAAEACSADPRCKAAADIDGNLFGDVRKERIKQPFLFVLSDWTLRPPLLQKTLASVSVKRFQQQQAELEQETQDTCQDSGHCWKAHIPGTRHFNFTDLAVLYSPGMRMMGYLGPVDGAKGLAETSSCVRVFFDEMLNPSSSSLSAETTEAGCSYQPLGHSPVKLQPLPH